MDVVRKVISSLGVLRQGHGINKPWGTISKGRAVVRDRNSSINSSKLLRMCSLARSGMESSRGFRIKVNNNNQWLGVVCVALHEEEEVNPSVI